MERKEGNNMLLVTGLTGKTGRCFLRKLEEEGYPEPIRAVVRPTSDVSCLEQSPLAIERVSGDLTDPEFLSRAVEGVDTVLHIANIRYSLGLTRAALGQGVSRLILVHTTGIYSKFKRASAEYLEIEQELEQLTANQPVSVTILRPTMIYGGVDDGNIAVFLRMVDKLRLFPAVGGGRFALQPVHREDLAQAYLDVLTHPDQTAGKIYDLSGSYPIDLIDILQEMSRLLGKKTRFVTVPFGLTYFGAVCLYGVSFGRVDIREKVQRLVEPRAYPHDQAAADFGYSPMDFREGLAREVEEYLRCKRSE